jgi:hypothetical protein
MSGKEENKQFLIADNQIHDEVIKILKDRIEKAIEKMYEGKARFRDDDGKFCIRSEMQLTITNEIVDYLINELSEKALLLNEAQPIKLRAKYAGKVF